MAANLNRPADFITKLVSEDPSHLLIPPSEFEKPALNRTSYLEIARQQILKLREENEQLKSRQNDKSQHTQVTHFPFAPNQNDYADELIKRQVGEIAELKSELAKCRQIYEQDILMLKMKCATSVEDCDKKLKTMKTQMKLEEEIFVQKLSHLNSDLQRTLEETEKEGSAMKDKFQSANTTLVCRVTELEGELSEVKRERDEKTRQLQEELRNKNASLKELSRQLQQLKTYITDAENNYKPAQVWKVENEAVVNKLQLAQAEKLKLQSELELMGVRFKSIGNILAVQEEELNQGKSGGLGKRKLHDIVITKWRQQVYTLLVQQKSAEIVNRNDVTNLHRKICDLENELLSRCTQVKVLEHSLQGKTAQLQLEVNKSQHLSEELEQTQQVAVKLDDQSKESGTYLCDMRQMVTRHAKQNEETIAKFEEQLSLLKSLNQRVGFAAGRMEVLKAQLLRKVAFTESAQDISKKSISMSNADEDISRDSEYHLCQELKCLVRERDSLTIQVQQDTSKWSQRLTEAKKQYEMEISTLKMSVQILTVDVEKKSKTCANLATEVTSLREDMNDKEDTIAQLQTELHRFENGVDSVLTDQRLKDEAECSERLAVVEKKLNVSKREHAKTVVTLRQMERSHARDLERNQALLTATETHLGQQVQRLQAQLLALERERNLMMAILKQEGLLNKLRSSRVEHVRLDMKVDEREKKERDRVNEEIEQYHGSMATKGNVSEVGRERRYEEREDGERHNGRSTNSAESVASVLQDLQTLTAVLFNDHDDEEEDENDDSNR